VAQLLSFPLGRAWARCVPNVTVFGVCPNPGPFSMKEHVLITIMASVGATSAYAVRPPLPLSLHLTLPPSHHLISPPLPWIHQTDIIAVQRVFYDQKYSFGFQWMIVMSTQLIGFSIGGVSRRFLVEPPSMIWPANLVTCALFNTLHSQTYAGIGERKGMSRERFFFCCFVGATFYSYIGSPLATPWWAEANIVLGFVLFFWILTPIIYYTNTWYTQYLPMSTRNSYDNTGHPYNVTRIINSDASLNLEEYRSYSPLFLSATFAVSYGLSFSTITATLTHAFCFYGKQILTQARRSLHEQPDVHARLMARYRRVPEWYYGLTFVAMFIFAIISVEILKTDLPIWAFLLALSISFIYVIPCGMIQAITNQQIGLNVIAELIVGYALPGRPVAMMLFKTWGYITMTQALTFSSDFKLGHYMKIPPRTMFFAQVVCTVVAGTVQLAVQAWMFSNIKGLCSPDQPNGYCLLAHSQKCSERHRSSGESSVLRGSSRRDRYISTILPLPVSSGKLTNPRTLSALLFFFPIGFILPIITWLLLKRFPNSWLRYVNIPVILSGTNALPPASAVNYVTWGIVGFIFQYVIRKRHFAWWTKYNYVLSAALDSGVAIGVLIVFFCLQYPNNGTIGADNVLKWWGNTVFTNTADYLGTPLRALPNGQTKFG
ncbi:hypothetical protein CVT26_007556, partial [Gymnopilus dilepis]